MLENDRMAIRVKLAQAALDYISDGELTPRMGRYLSTSDDGFVFGTDTGGTPVKDAVRPCCACALGSLIYAKFKQTVLTCREVLASNSHAYSEATFVADHLSDLFDPIELCYIEIAFEGAVVGYSNLEENRHLHLDDMVDECADFYLRHEMSERAQKILRSIVNNKGAVVPSTFASTPL